MKGEVAYALPEDLAESLRCKESYLRWAATHYRWRKARKGRRVYYHVEDAYRDLAEGLERRFAQAREEHERRLDAEWDTP